MMKAGVGAQQRARMLLQQLSSIEHALKIVDWHAVGNLAYLTADCMVARGQGEVQPRRRLANAQ